MLRPPLKPNPTPNISKIPPGERRWIAGLVLVLAGVAKGVIDYTDFLDPHAAGHLGLFGIVLALTGVQMLFIGLLADLIDQRMKM